MLNLLDILSNENLDELLNSLKWQWSESGNKGIAVTSIKEIESKSILATYFIIQIISLRRNIKIGDYNYRMLGNSISRTSHKIRRPDENKLTYTIRKITQ